MNDLIQFLIVFDLICFGVYFGGDIVCTALAKVRKKPGQKDPYEFEVEDEPDEPPLSIDAIRSASSTWFKKWTAVSLSSLARSMRM